MGNIPSSPIYALPIAGTSTEGSTPIYRSATHPDGTIDNLSEKLTNCWDIFQLGRKINPDGGFLGTRLKKDDGTFGPYTWKTYSQVEELAKCVGSGLINLGCVPTMEFPEERYEPMRNVKLIGIGSENREEWFVTEQAANAYNFTIVPLYETLGEEAIDYIFEQTSLSCVVCSQKFLTGLLKHGNSKAKKIICFDKLPEETIKVIAELGMELITWEKLVQSGRQNVREINPGNLDSVNTVSYTSGTTGNPKGVIQTQRNFVANFAAIIRGPFSSSSISLFKEDAYLSYLPLAHIFERCICIVITGHGGSIGMYTGDVLKLLDDMQELKPTLFASVPRLFNRIHDKVMSSLKEKSDVAQYLFRSALNAKVANLRKDGRTTHAFWDKLVFNKTKNVMGGRIRFMVVGSAPLAAKIQENVSVLLCAPLLEGFGMTESMGASFIFAPADPFKGTIGGVIPSLEFKLRSIPDMQYYVTTDPPKGELCLRGPSITEGYFRNPTGTSESYDAEGWFHTGDVCELTPYGTLKVTDRAKAIFKLSQGEYVAPEKVEQVYQQTTVVAQVFCAGYSTKPALVGLVVPDEEYTLKWAAKGKVNPSSSFADICQLEEFKKHVEKEMLEVSIREGLKGFEKIKAVELIPELFSVENGLLTPTFKLRRHEAQRKFEKEIEALYASLKL